MTYMANYLNLHAQYAINNDIRDMQIDIIAQKLVSSSLSQYLYRLCSRLFQTLAFDLMNLYFVFTSLRVNPFIFEVQRQH